MVVLGDPGEDRRGSYALEHEACPVLWVLEYISRDDPEKDYVKNFEKYEGVFGFPYHLLFDPDEQSLLLYHLHERRYVPVEETAVARLPIRELELEVGLLEGWVRFWFRGELLPIPAELRARMRELRQEMEKLQNDNAALVAAKQELTTKTQNLTAQTQELTGLTTRLQAQLKERDDQLQEQQHQRDTLFGLLRGLVEAKARQAGRQDILARLSAVTDPQQFHDWLVELG
jgi:hypothetical protein